MNNPDLAPLNEFKPRLDEAIDEYARKLLQDTELMYGSYSRDATRAYTDFLGRGGKRLRGALLMSAYEMLGGLDEQLSLAAARTIEIIHAYLLITDDICDQSRARRGGPTVHVAMEEYHKRHNLHGDSAHFGVSIAINAALAACHEALQAIGQLPTDDTTKLEALQSLHENLLVTVQGQFNDIMGEAFQDFDERHVLDMLTYKTAYYSFLSPLQFGAILAKAEAVELACLKDYSRHMGLAFQIADDIIGVFGDEHESGKSNQDDLREGKITILIARAMSAANREQRDRLLQILGNQNLTDADCADAKKIIEDTGALDYSRALAEKHAQSASIALDAAPTHWQPRQLNFLRALTTYVVQRGK
ncbi:MAG TPA: polyprenyl synthetase family protein [Candidatus Acidoferrum sp.]|nr:polyprenyl synthetase family protein [Candidatus Acidoferrum sp.]